LGNQTEVETTTSETRSKQPQATTETPTQSVSAKSQSHSEKTPGHGQIAEIAKQFPDVDSSRVYHYRFRMKEHCNDISKEEHNRIKVQNGKSSITVGLETKRCPFVSKVL